MSAREEALSTEWTNRVSRKLEAAGASTHAANNFDALRLFAALLVLVSHQFFFLGGSQPSPTGNTLGELAVMMFFVVSGYLVSESWYRDPHLVRFLLRRLLRLWPGLAVATLAIALAGAAVTSLPLHAYLGEETWHFIARNLQLRVVHRLPGVFDGSAGVAMPAVNGSWWTIGLETKCYLYLAALGLIGLRRRWCSVLVLAALAYLYVRALPGHPRADPVQSLRLLYTGFFMTGVCARQFREELLRHRFPALGVGSALFALCLATGQRGLAQWIVLAPLTLVTGSWSTPGLRHAGRWGDLSYGIYLYAYFVQQLTVRLWPGTPGLAGSGLVAVVVTAAVAWCSWNLVEAPALALKRRLRRWFPDQAP
jgi:peptidoglycan/LPS O-acetylase OafA/YrhL